jgi:hypothetical protein
MTPAGTAGNRLKGESLPPRIAPFQSCRFRSRRVAVYSDSATFRIFPILWPRMPMPPRGFLLLFRRAMAKNRTLPFAAVCGIVIGLSAARQPVVFLLSPAR